jgi:hypothetical protein
MEKENLDNGIKPDVNESLALAGLFRKVSVKERLPERYNMFIVFSDLGQVSQSYFSSEYMKFEKQDVEYWLEEIELPSKDEIRETAWQYGEEEPNANSYIKYRIDCAYREGAFSVLDFVLAGKAVTAKDNVR